MIVVELTDRMKKPLTKIKTAYDCTSCAVAVILSFIFFGALKGVHIGTIVCALVNGTIIGMIGRLLDHLFVFEDKFSWRSFFEKEL